MNPTALSAKNPPENSRSRQRLKSTSGWAIRVSRTPKTPSRAMPATTDPQLAIADQLIAEFCRP